MHRDLTSWVTVVVRPRILMELYAALSLYESRTTAAPAATGAAFGSGKFVVLVGECWCIPNKLSERL